ncbi:MAG TPA: 3-dehydroquinate synthase [Firmicutes bacterium]|nr:3-dehydroquinate synthase [Bacillota bacterium]
MDHIYLTGFMASGKTTVGQLLATELGRRFIDIDDFIARKSGKSIAEIFNDEGEDEFRRLEKEALREISSLEPAVVATGGGIVTNPENIDLMRRSGIIVNLGVSLETAVARASASSVRRPLIAAAPLLYEARREAYNLADIRVDTDGRAPDEVASLIAKHLEDLRLGVTLRIEFPRKTGAYDIIIRPGCMNELPRALDELGLSREVVVMSDETVWGFWGDTLLEGLRARGCKASIYVIPPGEASKNLDTVASVYDFLTARKLGRDTVMIALGGGVVGDTAGFIAATYMRGIPFVQVPTSLLAQVDSSIGGKVAVDHKQGKNLIGAFYQPRICLIDPFTLRTLPYREYSQGLAEVVKCAILSGDEFLELLEREKEAVIAGRPPVLTEVIRRCCVLKAEVVSQDERDEGRRMILNLGHTLAHALESLTGYGKLTHGEAVSIGLVWACRLAWRVGLAPEGLSERIRNLLTAMRLPVSIPTDISPGISPGGISPEGIIEKMVLDKKARRGRPRFVLPSRPGEVGVYDDVPDDAVIAAIQDVLVHADPST